MEDSGYGNAMTEIALALAMAFFSIMVLAMISMGVPATDAPDTTGAMLAKAEPKTVEAAKIAPVREDTIVIYYEGRYMDRDLHTLDPGTIEKDGRVLLALDPAMPMREALNARAAINVDELIVTALDERWLTTLRSKTDDQR